MSYKQLTMRERYQIEALIKEGLSQRAIAKNLNVHHSTISRELSRNQLDTGEYNALSASVSARLRYQYKPKNKRLNKILKRYIKIHLKKGWSPDQISGRMKEQGLESVSYETIYKYIYANKYNGGSLYKYLRHKNKKYNKRSSNHHSRGQIKNRISIDDRPKVVEEKSRIGDWEIDLIIGKHHHQAILTIVDRCSKFTLMKKVLAKKAEFVKQATLDLLKPIKEHVLTITSDNGKEFAYHAEITRVLDIGFYFAHPYRSCERGLNEHTNGLIREYFPKDKEFQDIKNTDIAEVQDILNDRPRKILGYKTPREVFFGKIALS